MNNKKLILIVVALLFSASNVYSQAVTKGLIGYWPFNGNANDESINNNHGNVTGATLTKDRFGNVNSAYKFDGNGDYIDCGDSANLFVSTNTTNFWFLYNDSAKAQIFVNDANSNSGEWGANYYHHVTAGIVATMGGGSNNSYIASVTRRNYRYADSMWHMFTSCYSAKDNSLRFYLDGCFVANINQQFKGFVNGKDSMRHNGNDHWIFGARSQYFSTSTSSPDYLKGCLDDVMLFNRVLTPIEISELYTGRIYYDTTSVYDTITTNDTTFYTVSDTITIHDTTSTVIYDTTDITIYDTSYVSINDTTFFYVYDTTDVMIYDTTRITIKDTVIHHDTFYIAVTDTLYIKSFLSTGSANPCVIKMYPNPTNDVINIVNGSACNMLGYTLTIVDNLGKLVYRSAISNKTNSVNLKNFTTNGLYLVTLSDSKGKIVSKKKIILY